jgi:hypothetical protein
LIVLHASVSAQKLGAVRIAVFAMILAYVLVTPLERFAALPPELHTPMGFLRLLPDEAWARLRSVAGLTALRGGIAVGAVLCMLGVRGHRAIAGLTVGLWLVFEGALYLGASSHRQLATLYCAMILAAFPAADGLSLRARRHPPQGSPELYAAALRLMAFSLLLTYAFTAFYRLAHGSPQVFWDGSMVAHLVGNSGRNGTFGFTYGVELVRALGPHTWVLDVAFFVGTVLEALALVCLLSRPFRRVWLGFVLVFHTANWLAMNIEFWLNCGLAVLLLLDRDPWRPPGERGGRA